MNTWDLKRSIEKKLSEIKLKAIYAKDRNYSFGFNPRKNKMIFDDSIQYLTIAS